MPQRDTKGEDGPRGSSVDRSIAKRCEILGLDAPKKTAFSNSDGTTDYGPFLTEDERRNRLLAWIAQQEADGEGG